MKGVYIVLEYCENVKTHDIDHLQDSLENLKDIKNGEIEYLAGCPQNFGLEKFIGLCERGKVEDTIDAKISQCNVCWKEALETEF